MATKLSFLILQGYTIETVSWLPKTHNYLGLGKFEPLKKPKHYAIRGTHIYVSRELIKDLRNDCPEVTEVVSVETVLENPCGGSDGETS